MNYLLKNIPNELRSYKQFVTWRYEKAKNQKQTKIPYSPQTGRYASVTDSNTWCSFDEAISVVQNYDGIGFVFTNRDPFIGIDMDVAEGEEPNIHQKNIFEEFISYAERSPSGRGLHIIVKGNLPTGTGKRDSARGIEVYSSNRFFTMTGDVVRAAPIKDCSAELQIMWTSMGWNTHCSQVEHESVDANDDDKVITQANNAANGSKFSALYSGKWQDTYPSQSEADFALINIIAFYTQNRAQICRIFLNSALGQRDKAKREDYVSQMLDKCFERTLPNILVNLPNPFSNSIEQQNKTFNLGELLQLAATEPDTQFTTAYLTPIGDVTLLSANGGVGKTFLALIWLLCISSGRPFFGLQVTQSPVLFVTAEDRRKECGKRLSAICADMQILTPNSFTKQTHDNFNLWEILGKPLWTEEKMHAAGTPTLTMIELEKRIVATNAKQVIVDNASSVFCANHNDNVQVTAFVSYLRQMAERTNCNILILAHVSADNATKSTSKTYFGSTAWHNSVRSRIYMELKPAQDGIDEHISVNHEKSNYGKLAEPFKLRRDSESGVLHLLSLQEIAKVVDEKITATANQVLNDIKEVCNQGGYIVSATQGPTNSYSSLSNYFPSKYRDGDKTMKQKVKLAIQRLRNDNLIVQTSWKNQHRKITNIWIPASSSMGTTL